MPDTPIADASTYPPEEQGSNAGCWVVGIITTFLVIILVIAGLFLPPFDIYNRLFGEPYAILSEAGEGITSADQGFSLIAATDAQGRNFGVKVQGTSLRDFLSGEDSLPDESLQASRAAIPPNLALQSPVYSIDTTGTAPDAVRLNVNLPGNTNPDLLDLYGWNANAQRWDFVPSRKINGQIEATTQRLPQALAIFQAAPSTPTVVISYDVLQVLGEDEGNIADIVAPAGLQPTLEGRITGSLAPGFTMNAAYGVMPIIRDFADPRALDTNTVNAIIGNSSLRSNHAREITLLASGGGFDGVFIDYRGIDVEQRDNFSAFIQELGANMRSVGLMLGVVVPAAENVQGIWQTGAYDWRIIGSSADLVQINLPINPSLYTPGETQLVEAMLRWATGEMSRYKLLLGLSAQSVREIASEFTLIGYDEGLAGLGNVRVESTQSSQTGSIEPGTELRVSLDGMRAIAGVDTITNAPYLEYVREDNSQVARIWLTTSDALRFRMDRTVPFSLAGIAFEDLLEDDLADGVLETILDYQEQIPSAPAPTNLGLRWSIEGGEGLIDEVTTGISESLVVTLSAPDGNYAINVDVIGVGQRQADSPRSGAAVALFRPTATPTPLPTSTPTPTPTVTPTPAPIIATQAPAPSIGGNFGASAPGAGSIQMGGFEYGGHVNNPGSPRTISAMQEAGMSWMKVQIRYSPGASPEIASGAIGAARSAGFKILIGTVGNPADLANGGESYMRDFAGWLGGIAGLGPDAIEVWNEPNIDREWPRNQISGAAYTTMLRYAYQAIKGANGSVMVISGAPAPTGAEGAFPGQVVNDDRFLADMVANGAMDVLDCVGVHYNEGIIPPTQSSGDPRDGYYTRYFPGILNTYWNITGGRKPLCFTELGYLSSEGYPGLPDFFAWAQNVTVEQQAAWLAQATALSSQSGRVRLLIVWNVDFTLYGADPQAGFAMIRSDGGCPACRALAGAR